jgi:4-amino-4-deoxy-L-arabinose transferase-like glycosyltransferase
MLANDLTHVIDPDAARHALNGALIYDMIRTGEWRHPIHFAERYYAHFPAISIPYHPPVFPAIEALMYAGLGVSTFTARLAVALCAGGSIWLLFLLALRLHGSVCLAAAVVLTFCSTPVSVQVGREVMLEYPALLFVFASIRFLDLDRWSRLSTAMAFAFVASLAVWTKHAVFLGLVPWFLLVIERRWRLVRRVPIWAFSAFFGAACIGLAGLIALAGFSGENASWPSRTVAQSVSSNSVFYLRIFPANLGLPGTVVAAAGVLIVLCFMPRHRYREARNLCVAWALAAFLVPLFVRAYDPRYLFFMLPAVFILAYTGMYYVLELLVSARFASLVTLAVGLAFFATYMRTDRLYVKGTSEAAAIVAREHARALYLGPYDGEFIHAVRVLDPTLESAVIRGDQFARAVSRPNDLLSFVRAHGINMIVVRASALEPAKDPESLFASYSDLFPEVRRTTVTSSDWRRQGAFYVYRFLGPASPPVKEFKVRSRLLGKSLNLHF